MNVDGLWSLEAASVLCFYTKKTVRLEAVSADENERVEQMRREEREAEEAERRAEELFDDGKSAKAKAKPAAKKRARR